MSSTTSSTTSSSTSSSTSSTTRYSTSYNNDDCAICLETLNQSKCCTTDCGHTFHSRCIFKNFRNSLDCPLCRRELIEDEEDQDEDQEEESSIGTLDTGSYYSNTINTAIEEADENNPEKLRIRQIHEAIKKKGYTEIDFISFLLIDNFPAEIKQKKDVFWRCINMMQEIDKICEREIAVDYRDERTYARVLQEGINLNEL